MSNITLTGDAASQAELEHYAGPDWRTPYVPPKDSAGEDKPAGEEKPAVEAPAAEEIPAKNAPVPETGEVESDKPKQKGGFQRKIDKLVAQNARLEKELEETRAKVKPSEAPQPQGPPQLKDFKTPEEWADARDAWKEQQAVQEAEAEEQKAVFDTYNKAVSAARAKYDDWDEVINGSNLVVRTGVQVAIVEMGETGPDVAYYLATHPELCEKLNEMRTASAIAEIGRIAEKFKPASSRSPEKPKAAPPKPITPVGSSASQSVTPLDQLSPSEFIRVRNRQEREKRFGR